MPSTECISDQAIRDHIARAIKEVFSTMLGQHAQLVDPPPAGGEEASPPLFAKQSQHAPYVVGTVGFIGEVNGLIYLYLPEKLARLTTCQMLGLKDSEIEGDDVINDAIGEITNMIVGVFKNGLCDSGYSCRLTIPSILRGSNFCIEPISSASRRIFYFDCTGYRLVADILMKFGE